MEGYYILYIINKLYYKINYYFMKRQVCRIKIIKHCLISMYWVISEFTNKIKKYMCDSFMMF